MKRSIFCFYLLAVFVTHLTPLRQAQCIAQTTISLTFTAQVNGNHQPLDSVLIENITHGGDTTLYAPDTLLVLDHGIGINNRFENPGNQMILHPAYPNPVTQTSTIRLWLPQHGPVTIRLYDIVGRELTTFSQSLGAGEHSFTFTPGKETSYLLVAEAADQRQVQKLINLSPGDGKCQLSYTGQQAVASGMRKLRAAFPWVPGDDLRLIGFASSGVDTIDDNPVQSAVYTFQFGTSPVYPPGTVHCNPANPTVVVDVTNPTTGKIWMDRNLGAGQVAVSSLDTAAYGDLYQWGRFADGHQCRTSATTATLSSSDMPGHGNFILAPTVPNDWRSPANDYLWQGVNGVNNPCPTGYRLPTEAELNAERLSWSSSNATGAFTTPLRLPLTGFRNHSTGSFDAVGTIGGYWSGTVSNAYSKRLYFLIDEANINFVYRARAISVRCIKN